MKILVFTTLYPNWAMPQHGVFVENRLLAYEKKYGGDIKVIAPVPWFPFQNDTFGKYARYAQVPELETRNGIDVVHPRYFHLPRIGMNAAPGALARILKKEAEKLIASGWDFDFIDAHYFYPDGVAAVEVARTLGKPVAVTARGTDINFIPNYPGPRKKIRHAAMKADAIIAVADALKEELVSIGAPEKKIVTLRNGVDLDMFAPANRDRIRAAMSLDGPVLLSVGHLIERKGHDIVIAALRDIPEATLLIAGEGPLLNDLKAHAKNLGLQERVRFLGPVPHEKLSDIYNAADVLVLASSREGWPNVLLEAMACGTPCVASNVWGSGEVIGGLSAGRVVNSRTPGAFAEAIKAVLNNPRVRDVTRHYAEDYSWDETAEGMHGIFKSLADKTYARREISTYPIRIAANEQPKLLVTVDTEEQFDWTDFENHSHSVSAPEGIEKFQALCAEKGATPLYFITWSLLNDDATAGYFKSLIDSKAADAGLHLHQWTTPPETGFSGAYYSFQKNLPEEVHLEKLMALAEAFEKAFGFRGIAHRAGRYGIAPENYALLSEAGVEYDFSPSVAFDFSASGGPDFSGFSNHLFEAAGPDWKVFVTPVSGAEAVTKTERFLSRADKTPGFAKSSRNRLSAVAKPMRLSPEGASLDELKALTELLIDDSTPIMTFTLHSTSLTVGASPYAKTAEDVEKILQTTRDYFDWFKENGGEFISFGDLKTLFRNGA